MGPAGDSAAAGGIAAAIAEVRAHIAEACERAGRSPDEVTLVAVTKTRPAAAVLAALAAGIADIGENRVQEAAPKFAEVETALPPGAPRPVRHLIGHLQSNKVRAALKSFDVVHSADSLRLAQLLSAEAGHAGRVLPVFVQANVSGEETKSGFEPEVLRAELGELLESCAHLRVEGLMTMAPLSLPGDAARPVFGALRALRDELWQAFAGHARLGRGALSMGMTSDYEAAIAEGSTHVRIGTSIFGTR